MAVATPAQHTQQGQASTPSATADAGPSDHNQQYFGDRMFNVYIWDYCMKRGYVNTARELIEEAKLEPNPARPIDAKQGLLYEWWTVFWYLFHAKSNNTMQSTEDAMLYVQSRLQQQNAGHPRFPPNGVRSMPGMGASGVAGPNGAIPGPLPPNSIPHPHGMPNGIGPSHNTPQPQQSQPPPQQAAPLGFPGNVQHQPNGVTPQSAPRGSMNGQPGHPPRAGSGYYQSPTMAHPHTPTGGGPPPYPGPGPAPNAIGGPTPPNGYPPQAMRAMPRQGAHPNGVANAGSPGFAQGSSGSRAPTPAQNAGQGQPGSMMTQPSPSMANRTVPQTPPSFGGMAAPNGPARGPPFEQMQLEIAKIDPQTMNELRTELGLGNREPASMSIDEKARLVAAFRQRSSGTSNAQPNRQGRGSKRSSTSPGNQHADILPKDGSSPPAQKKARPSPDQPTPSSSNIPPAGNAVGQMFPPHGPPGAMRGPPFTPQMQPGPMMQHAGIPNHFSPQQGGHQQKNNAPFPGNAPSMNKMAAHDQHPQFTPDATQPRSAPPPFAVGSRQPQGKPGPGMMPPPSSPASGPGKPQTKMEGLGNSPLTAPPSSSGSTGPRGPSPATPAPGAAQVNASMPSPSAAANSGNGNGNLSRPATASSNPPSTAPPGSGSAGIGAPPASASAPPGPADPSLAQSNVLDFMSTGFDDFTSMFGRDEPIDFTSNFDSWFGSSDMGILDSK